MPPADPRRAEPQRRRSRKIAIVVGALAGIIAGSLWLLRASTGDRAGSRSAASAQARAPSLAGSEPAADSRQPPGASDQPSGAGREPAADSRQPSTAGRQPTADAGTNPTASAPARSPASFTVEVRSAPPGARVTVAGKRVGVTPATIALDAPASITVSRAGYRSQRVRAERGGPIDVRLVPARPAPGRRPTAAGETLD